MTLEDYLRQTLPGKVSSSGWFNTTCLSPDHQDTRPSFGVNLSNGFGKCFSCGFTLNLIELIARLDGVDSFQAALKIPTLKLRERLELTPRKYGKQKQAADHPYWKHRGLKLSTVLKFQLSYDPATDTVEMPVHYPDGRLAGYVKRKTGEKLYTHSEGLAKTQVLFGYHLLAKPLPVVYVPEGPIDAAVLVQEGFPAFGRLGWSMSQEQVRLARVCADRVVVVVDLDAQGRRQADWAARTGFWVAFPEIPFKDPGEMLQQVGAVNLHEFSPLAWLNRVRRTS